MQAKVVKIIREADGFGVAVTFPHSQGKRVYWLDCWIDEEYGDLCADWNQYIFFLNDSEDVHRRDFQNRTDAWEAAWCEASEALQIYGHVVQDDFGKWYKVD